MLTRSSVRNVETSKVHKIVSVGHGYVPSVANVHMKSRRSRLEAELFCFVVDLLTVVDEICPIFGRQRNILTECMITTFPLMSSRPLDPAFC